MSVGQAINTLLGTQLEDDVDLFGDDHLPAEPPPNAQEQTPDETTCQECRQDDDEQDRIPPH